MPAPNRGNATPATITAALILSILFHFTLWETLPAQFSIALIPDASPIQVAQVDLSQDKPEEIPAHLLPEELRPPKPRFVEINPEAPANLPPETRNTGAATQRAAQPVPDSDTHSPFPKLDGEDPHVSHIINNIPRELRPSSHQPIPGIPLGKPDPSPEPPPPPLPETKPPPPESPPTPETKPPQPQPETESPQSPAPSMPPLRGNEPTPEPPRERKDSDSPTPLKPMSSTEKATAVKPDTEKPSAATVADPKEKAPPVPSAIRAEAKSFAQGEQPLPAPLPRPQAAKVGTTGVLLKKTTGTNKAGTISLDARFSEYGDYAQRMIEIVQASWWLTLERIPIQEKPDACVTIEFTLCKDGVIKDLIVLNTTASRAATYACRDAIESRSPYDPWTEEMIKMLGDEDRTRFSFHYR